MSESGDTKSHRDRSPSYPAIPLDQAVERLIQFETYFKRHPGPLNKLGLAWEMAGNGSQAGQIGAALKAFGLIEYQGSADARQAVISDDGRTYLRAQQDTVKQAVLRRAALRPKSIAGMWQLWGAERPPDPVCLDALILNHGFSDRGAPLFLKIYDATIAYAGLSDSDKSASQTEAGTDDNVEIDKRVIPAAALVPPAIKGEVRIMEGERIVFTEEGQPNQYLKLVASGEIDDSLLEALEHFVVRQRKRITKQPDAGNEKKD